MKQRQGFTLIELLIVIAIIGILAAIIFVAVDPARRLAEARNAERWSSVNSILNGVLKHTVDSSGVLPSVLTAVDTGTYEIGTCGSGADCAATTTTSGVCVDLASIIVPSYLSAMPSDPLIGTASETEYYIYRAASGRLQVGSCAPETVGGSTPTVSVSR